jgi:hypothetical protein
LAKVDSPSHQVEVKAIGGIVTLIRKPENEEDEYTPEQRRKIDARLVKSDDIRKGRTFGPFNTHREFIASLHKESKKLRAKKTKRPVR